MGWLTDWVRQIVFFLIFMSLFYQIVPDKKYKSYLKLFASLVLILLTVNPLLQFFDMRQSLEFQQNVFAYPGEVEEFRLKAEQAQGQQYEDILETYRQTVEEQLRGMAEGFGLYARGSAVSGDGKLRAGDRGPDDGKLSEAGKRFGQGAGRNFGRLRGKN